MSNRGTLSRQTFHTRDGNALTVAYFYPPQTTRSGIIFVPPLIGGSYIQHYREMTYLVDAGFLVVSFNYRGHQKSEGIFDIQTAFSDAHEVARQVRVSFPGEKLFAIGTCFGSMPLFHILSKDPHLFDKITFVNAISNLRESRGPLASLGIYLQDAFPTYSLDAARLVTVVLNRLFPEVDKSPRHFGILSYDQVNVRSLAWDYFFYKTPQTVRDLSCPVLCCYGKDDRLLRLNEVRRRKAYQRRFRKFFSGVEFLSYEVDHYFEGLQARATQRIVEFFQS